MYPETEQSELQSLIQQFQPKQILSIGPAGQELFADYLASCKQCALREFATPPTLDALDDYGRFDLVFVSHVLERMPKSEAEQLIARLRDLHCDRLIIVMPIGTDWSDHVSYWQQTDLLGLGFSLLAEFHSNQHMVHIYAFDIASYKTTPEWLNNKYWANPEMFNKYWW
ncbi:MAG: hypothetical protein HKM94_09495 [Halobacteria archaeon]|nr:hypothetical protein [Halobacteria archaeon]